MPQLQRVAWILAVFFLGCAASHLTAAIVPPAHADTATNGHPWEYVCVHAPGDENPTNLANQFGAEDWELAVDIPSGNAYRGSTLCFKRPK